MESPTAVRQDDLEEVDQGRVRPVGIVDGQDDGNLARHPQDVVGQLLDLTPPPVARPVRRPLALADLLATCVPVLEPMQELLVPDHRAHGSRRPQGGTRRAGHRQQFHEPEQRHQGIDVVDRVPGQFAPLDLGEERIGVDLELRQVVEECLGR